MMSVKACVMKGIAEKSLIFCPVSWCRSVALDVKLFMIFVICDFDTDNDWPSSAVSSCSTSGKASGRGVAKNLFCKNFE